MTGWLSGVAALVAVAAATPADAGLADELAALARQDLRVATIGFRLATANRARCPVVQPQAGLLFHAREQYGPAAQAALGSLDDRLTVLAVVADSPADRAGVVAGDRVTAIAGHMIAARSGHNDYARVAEANVVLADALATGPASIVVERDGKPTTLTIDPQVGCVSDFQVLPDRTVNASADGRLVTVTSALADYAADDDQLAAVIAHEMAHNILSHRARLDAQKVDRGFFGKFGRNAERIRETEIEADRLSVVLLAGANYPPEAAIAFWQRFDRDHGHGIFADATHLNGTQRIRLIEAAIAQMGTRP